MSTKWYSKKWGIVLLHTAAWILLYSLPFLLRPSYGENNPARHENAGSYVPYALNSIIYTSFFYLNALVLIPRLFYHRKYSQYGGLLLFIFLSILSITWFVLFYTLQKPGFNVRAHFLFNFFFFLFILAGSTAYQMLKDRAEADRNEREKVTENLKTELSLLRSQASPHFMFNVLNNMVALARKKSDLLEPSLLKFSSLMRYMLYETDEEKVPLEKETEYLQNYIDLQQQRFGKNVTITINMPPADENYVIEPMLLIPFVENAFKHGTGIIENAQINVQLLAEKGELNFTVANKYNPASAETKDKTSGIGLNNVTRRLNLLYGNKQKLLITKHNDWFTVSLKLNLQ
jgi:two-component system LytT family sensor kinase